MLEKIIEKALENSEMLLNGRIHSMSESRKTELEQVKSKVRESPDEVEKWFDKEITKISNLTNSSIRNTINNALDVNTKSEK